MEEIEKRKEIGIVLVMHGGLGPAFLETVTRRLGRLQGIEAVKVDPAEDRDSVTVPAILDAINRVDKGRGVVMVSDMPGATPYNASIDAANQWIDGDNKANVIGGANMPILIELIARRSMELEDAVNEAIAEGVKKIGRASDGVDMSKVTTDQGECCRHALPRQAALELCTAK